MNPITSLYIHFPFCQHLCNYCDFYKNKLEDIAQVVEFESLLMGQIEFQKKFLSKNGKNLEPLETLYIGGGTPSLWKNRGISFLKSLFLSGELVLAKGCEFTIEVDPDAWTEEELDGWLSIGVNRFSIGSQAFSNKYIKLMDRTHALEDVVKTVKYFHDRKLNFSVDLMLGLPSSEDRNIKEELDHLLSYNPNHLSVYILKARKNYPLARNLPIDEIIRDEYLNVSEILKERGYDHYEVSNFSRNSFKSKHNIKYWNYNSVAGLGPNATGLIVNKESAIRYQWKSTQVGMVEEVLSGTSLIIEKLFLGLRHKGNFSLNSLFTKKGDSQKLNNIFQQWMENGYLETYSDVNNINLSSLGYLMCDSLIDDVFKKIEF